MIDREARGRCTRRWTDGQMHFLGVSVQAGAKELLVPAVEGLSDAQSDETVEQLVDRLAPDHPPIDKMYFSKTSHNESAGGSWCLLNVQASLVTVKDVMCDMGVKALKVICHGAAPPEPAAASGSGANQTSAGQVRARIIYGTKSSLALGFFFHDQRKE